MTNPSYSFERIADRYEQTRGETILPGGEAARTALIELGGLQPGCRLLDLGTGTGRWAGALREAGLDVVGLDLSRRMMRHARARQPTLPLIQGDVTRLPFGAGSFDRALAAHLFFLIPDWPAALAEARRVLRPGGALLHSFGALAPASAVNAFRLQFVEIVAAAGRVPAWHPGARSRRAVVAAAVALGAEHREREVVWRGPDLSPAQVLANVRADAYTWTWRLPPDRREPLLAELEAWARAAYPGPAWEATPPVENRIVWDRFSFS